MLITLVSWTLPASNTSPSTVSSSFVSIIATRSCSSFSTNESSKTSKTCTKKKAWVWKRSLSWITRIALIWLKREATASLAYWTKSPNCPSLVRNILQRQCTPITQIISGNDCFSFSQVQFFYDIIYDFFKGLHFLASRNCANIAKSEMTMASWSDILRVLSVTPRVYSSRRTTMHSMLRWKPWLTNVKTSSLGICSCTEVMILFFWALLSRPKFLGAHVLYKVIFCLKWKLVDYFGKASGDALFRTFYKLALIECYRWHKINCSQWQFNWRFF